MQGVSAETVEVWLVDLAAAAEALRAMERAVPRLPRDQHDSLFATPERSGDDRALSHIALRLLIERVAGVGVRGQVLAKASGGKPFLGGHEVEFSLSHGGGHALIGLSREGPIGVDLEGARTLKLSAARRHELEQAAERLSGSPLVGTGDARTLRAWVRLEAAAKLDGLGIGQVLTALGVGAGRREGAAPPLASIALADLDVGTKLTAAAARHGPAVDIPVRHLPVTVEGIAALIAE